MDGSACLFKSESWQTGFCRQDQPAAKGFAAPESKLPTQAGRYQILYRLGRGAMGEVFVARDTYLERKVALKFMLGHGDEREDSQELLFHEARAAAAVDHPFVCKVYDIGEIRGQAYIAMEYVQGETLKQRLARGNPSIREALRLALEMAEAIEFAHDRGIIYRDLKPSNIMLAAHGHVKVMDFGIASRLPVRGNAGGTPESLPAARASIAYASPEQLSGQPADARSDVFCMGIVLYEMMSGRNPFRRPDAAATASAILIEDPAPLCECIPGAPQLLDHVLRKALAKEPVRRYATMRALRLDLLEVFGAVIGTPRKKCCVYHSTLKTSHHSR